MVCLYFNYSLDIFQEIYFRFFMYSNHVNSMFLIGFTILQNPYCGQKAVHCWTRVARLTLQNASLPLLLMLNISYCDWPCMLFTHLAPNLIFQYWLFTIEDAHSQNAVFPQTETWAGNTQYEMRDSLFVLLTLL